MKRIDPMVVLSIAVLIGVIGMAAASFTRDDAGLSAEETALLAAIVGAVAGASLPRSADSSKDDSPPILAGPVDGPEVDPGLAGDPGPDYGAPDADWFFDDEEPNRGP